MDLKRNSKSFTPLEINRSKIGQGRNRKFLTGFTLVELLVVVAIIGLLLSIISIGYTTQRRSARDARRISDLKQVKSGMDVFFQDASGYPDESEWVAGTTLNCSSNNILLIPNDPGFPVYDYTYAVTGGSLTGCGITVWRGYTMTFYMEKQERYYYMDEDGVVRDDLTDAVISIDTLL